VTLLSNNIEQGKGGGRGDPWRGRTKGDLL